MKTAIDLRRQVLDASLDLIAHEGLSALSMREVARRAGVSHQAPYHHFGDREGILVAIAHEGFEGLTADMRAAIAKQRNPIDKLQAIGVAYVTFALRAPSHFKVMFRAELVPLERHAEARECAESCFGLVVAVADEVSRFRTGRSDPALPFAAWSLAHGLATLLLEGKIGEEFGKGAKARAAAIEAVLRAFTKLMRD